MELDRIIDELKQERERLSRAIAALEGSEASRSPKRKIAGDKLPSDGARARRGHLTPAGRKRLSEIMKKRWAARRRAGS